MRTLNDIAVQLKTIALEVGGHHLTDKEIETQLYSIARELDDINMNFSLSIEAFLEESDRNFTGLRKSSRARYLRLKNMEEHSSDA